MTVKVFMSTDVSAPVLTGQNGSLISLLDACLVNGYGSKVSLGWSKPFSGSNLAVYRQLAGGQRYLRVDNSGISHQIYSAKIRGFETMSDASTGTGPFPTDSQSNGGLSWRISTTQDSTARPWILIGDEKIFYICIETGWSTTGKQFGFFGDFISYNASDLYNQVIGGVSTGGQLIYHGTTTEPGSIDSSNSGVYVCRPYTQLGSSSVASLPFDGYQFTRVSPGLAPSGSWPQLINPASGDLFFGKHYVADKVSLRGEMPGMWAPLFLALGNFAHGDIISGTGSMSGKTLKMLHAYSPDWGNQPYAAIETSNTWY